MEKSEKVQSAMLYAYMETIVDALIEGAKKERLDKITVLSILKEVIEDYIKKEKEE